ncbi:oxidoreductase domain protein [Gluconacetobacter diazotrophicus PA1 5]|uniref:Gfo/Idh/MocA family protein n=1 Tax=Gluconacetobacter diazotrophicus TaxID=33996 RepID=UPI000173D8EC|nr:Gfo/Idh/MocA family oxidoreductase [Gluconacetobacter diazotrophicus]ACI52351.1 oxidoreductase domain protein [Gluconacetobacter diazotrophicus PA1 5]
MTAMRWGLIGATIIGREWMIRAIRDAGGTITSVYSTDAERGRRYAREFDIPDSTTDLDTLLQNVDAVYISTTNDRHHAECLAAARAGRHVLCEKPLATRYQDAVEMVAACEAAGVVMATNHHLRNAATHRAIRDVVAGGRIGRPLAARIVHGGALPAHLHGWRLKDVSAGAGAILDLTVHDSDLLRFALDDEPRTAMTLAQNGGLAQPGIEDAAMSTIAFGSGLIAQIYESFTTPFLRTSFEVHGTAGSVIAQDCMSQTPGGTVTLRTEAGEETLPLEQEDYYQRGVRAFHAAIAGQGRPAATGADGLVSLAVALAARRSAETGKAEPVMP